MNFYITCAALLFLLFPNVADAQEERPVHIVIAADHSGSMHKSGNIATQVDGIVAALEQYLETCSVVRVSYIAWGVQVDEPQSFLISDTQSRTDFVRALQSEIRYRQLNATLHIAGLLRAIEHVNSTPASYSAVVFITDEAGAWASAPLPARTLLFKVSLGDNAVASYLSTQFMPNVGRMVHANGAASVTKVMNDIFSSLTDACLG